jgi:hypothetical protein
LTTCLFVLPAYAKYSGGSGTAQDPYQIATAADLIALGETPADYDKHFLLTADIDLDPKLPGRKVFDKAVIGLNWTTPFTGVFDGNGHKISHLTVKGQDFLGLFGQLAFGGEVKDLGVADVSITGSGSCVGGLAGENQGTVSQCYSTGAVSGSTNVGGLVGAAGGESAVTHCYSVGSVSGGSYVGGLVGQNGGTVTCCYSTGGVSGAGFRAGGLVGNNHGTVTQCHSIGAVSGGGAVGGLVGDNENGSVICCYSTAVVNGVGSVGGLVGLNERGNMTCCYSAGAVRATGNSVGGLVGYNECGTVTQCYSTGTVAGASAVGGLVGKDEGIVSESFWDTQTSGQAASAGGIGRTTAQMQDPNAFRAAGWDFVGQPDGPHDIWAEPEGGGYPILWWQLSSLPKLPTFSGGSGEPDDPYRISTPTQLNSIGHNPRLMGAHFELVNDIDLGGVDFYIIGDEPHPFTGSFNGDGHTVAHLTITGGSFLGLFGRLEGEVRNLGVVDVDMTGSGQYVGGLVGFNSGTVTQCHGAGAVGGGDYVGGLVGQNDGSVTQCYSTGAVSGTSSVGGLVGENWRTVTQCYSTGVVGGSDYVGGLVGHNYLGTVTRCYSTGSVSGSRSLGGLIGVNTIYHPILHGIRGGLVSACFWDIQTSGQVTSAGGTGLTTAEMKTAKTFLDAGWDFVGETANGTEDIWWILEGKDYPRLWWEAAKK